MTDDDRVLIIRKWWSENGVALIVTVVLAIVGVVGWRWYHEYVKTREEAASATYTRYLEARQRGAKPEEVAGLLATIDNDFRGSAYRVFTLFYRAHDAMTADDAGKASDYLQTAIKEASDAELRDVARLRLARLQYQSGDADAALATLRGVKGKGFLTYAGELKGDILLSQNKPDEAREAYQAAKAAAQPDQPQPVLDMKIVDLAKPNAAPSP